MAMRRFPRTAAAGVIPFALAVGACDSSEAEWHGTVRDSAGVTIVSNAGAGLWAPGDAWTLEVDLLIGAVEGALDYQFGQIAGLDVDDEGRIYVLDQQARQIRVFDGEGRFLRAMGRGGSGPGELSQAAGPLFAGPDGMVLVPDIMNQRINLYSADGEPAGSIPLPMTDGIPVRWVKTANQQLVQQAMVMAMPGMTADPKNVLLRRNLEGAILDTLLVMEPGESMDFAAAQPRIRIFAREPAWGLTRDDRLIHGHSDQYRLHVLGPNGSLERIVEMKGEVRPVTAGDEAAFRRVFRRMWEDVGIPQQAIDMQMQMLSFAETYPAFINLVGGPQGTIWVQGVQTPETVEEQGGTFDFQDMGGPTWDVFDAEGRFLGTVRMPDRFTPFFFAREPANALYGIQRDELDVQYVARLSLGPSTLREGHR
jgi:hypothetical protein